MTYSQAHQTAALRQLLPEAVAHSWDLCIDHVSRVKAPVGWRLVDPEGFALVSRRRTGTDSLTALAEMVAESGEFQTGLVMEPTHTKAPRGRGANSPHPSELPPTPARRRHLYLVTE